MNEILSFSVKNHFAALVLELCDEFLAAYDTDPVSCTNDTDLVSCTKSAAPCDKLGISSLAVDD